MSVIVYGPQGCGKTRSAESIAERFGLSEIIDDWKPGDELPDDALALTNVAGVPGALMFDDIHCGLASAEILRDLRRDMPRVLKVRFGLGCTITNLSRIKKHLGVLGRFDEEINIDNLIHSVMLELGCEVLPRSYDRLNTWYQLRSDQKVNSDE